MASELPEGASVLKLKMNADRRGVFTELYRESWFNAFQPIQWSVLTSKENVLRGVHAHKRHTDYMIHIQGRAVVALRDARRGSPSAGLVSLVEMNEDQIEALVIPPGVLHGFYFHAPSTQMLAVTEYWCADDEIGCYYADPALEIRWPCQAPVLSERDKGLPPLSEILDEISPWRPTPRRIRGEAG